MLFQEVLNSKSSQTFPKYDVEPFCSAWWKLVWNAQAGKLRFFGTRPNWAVSYVDYTSSVLFSTHPAKFSLTLASGQALVSQPDVHDDVQYLFMIFLSRYNFDKI